MIAAGAALLEVDLGPGVRAAFTTTVTGNLSLALGDDDAAVRARRDGVERWLGAPLVYTRQVHGAHVHVSGLASVGQPLVDADAQLTVQPVGLAVLVADCVPVLLADPDRGVVAAVHAGRRGVEADVVAHAVAAMVAAGAAADRLRAVVGPSVCGACYEVPEQMRDAVDAAVPGAASTTAWGTPALDLPGAVARQLAAAGVGRVASLGLCTLTDERWFSHRGAGQGRSAGRFAGVVRPGVSQRPDAGAGLA